MSRPFQAPASASQPSTSEVGERAVLLLPTYNEADNLKGIVEAIFAAAPKLHVMVLDDSSPDGTGQLADALARKETRLSVVHRNEKKGLGAAYVDGFQRALRQDYAFILQMDADFSHPPEQIPTLLKLARSHDVVLGSRWVAGGGTENWPWRRRLLSRGGSFYARSVLGLKIRDLTGGFKCFRRQVLAALALEEMHATGYAFQIEMTYRALQHGFTVVESPILFSERRRGNSKMSGNIFVEAVLTVPGLRFGRGRR